MLLKHQTATPGFPRNPSLAPLSLLVAVCGIFSYPPNHLRIACTTNLIYLHCIRTRGPRAPAHHVVICTVLCLSEGKEGSGKPPIQPAPQRVAKPLRKCLSFAQLRDVVTHKHLQAPGHLASRTTANPIEELGQGNLGGWEMWGRRRGNGAARAVGLIYLVQLKWRGIVCGSKVNKVVEVDALDVCRWEWSWQECVGVLRRQLKACRETLWRWGTPSKGAQWRWGRPGASKASGISSARPSGVHRRPATSGAPRSSGGRCNGAAGPPRGISPKSHWTTRRS